MCQVIGSSLRTDIKIVVLAPGILFVIICFANIQPPLSTLPTPESKVPPSPNPPLHQDPSLPITCPVAVFLNGVQKTDLEQRLLLYILCNSTFDPCQRTTKHILEKIKDENIP